LRILVVYAHPLETSFIASLHVRAVETLRAGGHEVDDLDLYAERFDPVMSREQFAHYVDIRVNSREVEAHAKRLGAAEALVLVFPVWFDGLPAMMQGYFQRVFLPGVALRIDEDGLFHPNLWNLKRMAAVCTYGEDRRAVAAKNNPVQRFVRYNIGALIDPKGRFEYLAHYNMNFSTAARRAAFMKRVTRAFEAW
jgi:NAD(P)H dehydrogenase (quinone)